jgi:hypothetical protein
MGTAQIKRSHAALCMEVTASQRPTRIDAKVSRARTSRSAPNPTAVRDTLTPNGEAQRRPKAPRAHNVSAPEARTRRRITDPSNDC